MSEKYVIFHVEGGVGKNILATAVCSSIKNAYAQHKLIVVTPWPEVFLHNPEVYRVYKTGNFAYFYEDFILNKESIILRSEPYHSGEFFHQGKSLIEIWCDLFNIPCISMQPQIFLSQRELVETARLIDKKGPILLIHPFGGGSESNDSQYSWARDLPPSFAQKIVNKVYKNFDKVLHFRKDKQLELENTISITDSIRNLFCYTRLADKIIAIDSMVQHVAAALQIPSAVAWIANSPVVFGHQIHTNILPSQPKVFRHLIDSYMEDYDWSGRRLYECPYNDLDNIFDEKRFLEYCNI
jgi:ADP-heptose:LPS heptosyltransferase